jgi:SPP1 family predicted phage head-tail adaptor
MPLPRLSALPRRQGAYTAPGAMNQWIQILAPGLRNAGDGSQQPASPVYTGWAEITKLSGQELLKAQQIVQQVTHEVVIPSPEADGEAQAAMIPESGQVLFDGRIFQIESISDPDERDVELHLLCVERNQNS